MFGYPVAGASVPATGISEGTRVLKEYEVVMNGVRTTMQLDEANARGLGVWVDETVETKQAPAPKNKARTAKSKAGDSDDTDA